MYVCMNVCIHVCMYIYMHTSKHIMSIYVCTCILKFLVRATYINALVYGIVGVSALA